MKFKDNIYLLLSYTNASDIKTKYPNIKSIAIINIIGVILYFIIPSFLAKAIITILLIAVNYCFKEIRGIAITFTPVVIWVLLFSTAKDIPMDWKRPIDVDTLINLEKKFGSVSFKFYKNENVFFDLLAWLPYGIFHYLMPFIVGIYLIFFYKPGYTSAYVFFFGIMNVAGVLTQLAWPTSPPWYYKKYGTNAATYGMHGDPAGLQRIDDLFHMNFYYTTFTGNPLPWGAWPSLHSGFAVYSATFLTFLFPKYFLIFYLYVAWIWWATMYLGHHYFIDLLGGLIYALVSVSGSILYIIITKPYHKDYNELKTILIQEDIETTNIIQRRKIHSNNHNSYPISEKPKGLGEQREMEQKFTTADSTVVNGGSIQKEDSSSSSHNEYYPSYDQDPKGNNKIISNNDKDEDSLGIPNNSNLDKMSVISIVDQPPNIINNSIDITNTKLK
ncbi:PAP2-domain-containing protein [Neocallimastix lanati (nom. inval.)]|jgi:membrane-associated phospholipid phosphatase|nr:PAP2-domain-containing protein [Neocallimastix sp. JGI-2020a]